MRQLARRKRGAPGIVRTAIYAVLTVVYAVIGHEHFEQRNAAAIGREGMADTAGDGVSEPAAATTAVGTAGSTGDIIFSGIGKNAEFIERVHNKNLCLEK